MGIGMALTEETLFDERSGRIMNAVARRISRAGACSTCRSSTSCYTDMPDPHTPLGAHGIGEIGITGRGGRDCERRLSRDRQARARSADHARQAVLVTTRARPGILPSLPERSLFERTTATAVWRSRLTSAVGPS